MQSELFYEWIATTANVLSVETTPTLQTNQITRYQILLLCVCIYMYIFCGCGDEYRRGANKKGSMF